MIDFLDPSALLRTSAALRPADLIDFYRSLGLARDLRFAPEYLAYFNAVFRRNASELGKLGGSLPKACRDSDKKTVKKVAQLESRQTPLASTSNGLNLHGYNQQKKSFIST